ncbi:hypothetical protein BGW42_002136, partial [Actinomortierella wolfii]
VTRAVDLNDPVIASCIRQCDLKMAAEWESNVKNQPDPNNSFRKRGIRNEWTYRSNCYRECIDE